MLKGVTSTETGAQPPCNCLPLQSLPPELIQKVFSFLPASDLHTLTTVSRDIHDHAITAANLSEMDSIKSFIKALISMLEEKSLKKSNGKTYRWQVNNLKRILNDVRAVRSRTLLDLRKHILALKEQVTDLLKTMDSEDTVALRAIHCPHFFENIFDVAAQKREADRVKTEHYNNPNSIGAIFLGSELHTVCLNLCIYDGLDRVLELADSCSDFYRKKDDMLSTVVEYLKDAEEFDKAIDVVKLFTSYAPRGAALTSISDHLASIGEFDRAIHVAASNWDPSYAYERISVRLAKAGLYDRAYDVVKLIPNRQSLSRALVSISDHLVRVGELDKALLFADLIFEGEERYHTIKSLSIALATAGLYEKAIDCAAKLPRFFKLSGCGFLKRSVDLFYVFNTMMDTWIRENKIISDCSTFDSSCMDFSEHQNQVLDYLTKKMTALSKQDDNVRPLSKEKELRHDLLYSFSKALTGVGAFKRAIELAALIDDENIKREAFACVSNALLLKGIESTLFSALSVSDRKARRSVLSRIFANAKCDLQFVMCLVGDALQGASRALKEDEIIDIGLSLPWEKMIRIIADIFVAFTKAGNREKAFEAVHLIVSRKFQSDVLELAFEDLCKEGDLSRAVEIAQTIQDPSQRNLALKKISGAFDLVG